MLLLTDADVHAPEPLGVRHLLVAGGRIAFVGAPGEDPPALDPRLPVERLACEGRRVVPGFVDSHAHVTGGGGEAGPHTAVPRLGLSTFLRAGVTTAIGLLGTDDEIRTTASLLARTRALRAEGMSAWCLTGGYHVPPTTLTGTVRGDLTHLEPVIGVGEVAISDHRSSHPSDAELIRLAGDAHVAGLLTGKAGVVHLHVGEGPGGLDPVRRVLRTSALPAATLHPTHVNRTPALFDDARRLADEHPLTIDVTALDPIEDDPMLPAHEALGRWFDAGLPEDRVSCSSDAGGSLPTFDDEGRVVGLDTGRTDTLPATFAALVTDGRTVTQALRPFTSTPARVWRLDGKGRIAVGADADLLVLDETHRPRDVVARGAVVVREHRLLRRGTFEHDTEPTDDARP